MLETRVTFANGRNQTLVGDLIAASPTHAVILSQVVLSFALPFALVPLLLLTSRHDVMNSFANSKRTKYAGWLIVTIIVSLNALLLWQTFAR